MDALQKGSRLALNLVRIMLLNPKRLPHVLGTALAASEEVVDRSVDLLRFPVVKVEDLLPETGFEESKLGFFPIGNASISVLEAVSLALLMSRARARTAFEFGTYKGVSISQIALNLPPEGCAYTLDLPEGQTTSQFEISFEKDVAIAFEAGKGSLVPESLRGRIRFLRQDSALFDPASLEGQVDFVFVDGAHNFEYVRNDSEKGWRMLRPGGIIAWHDCSSTDRDVVRYLLSSPYEVTRIFGTALAFAAKPAGS